MPCLKLVTHSIKHPLVVHTNPNAAPECMRQVLDHLEVPSHLQYTQERPLLACTCNDAHLACHIIRSTAQLGAHATADDQSGLSVGRTHKHGACSQRLLALHTSPILFHPRHVLCMHFIL